MTWQQFRAWAQETLGYKMEPYSYWGREQHPGPAWRAIWGKGNGSFAHSRTSTGSGYDAQYGPIQQRRLALWLRARELVGLVVLAEWLDAGESYDDGWLVNDGTGIRWEANPDPLELVKRGFVAIKCGL